MDLAQPVLEEAESMRRSLRLLREYDYQTAALDILRSLELAADKLSHTADDLWKAIGIAQIDQQCVGSLLEWLPDRRSNWTYRPSKDVIDEDRIQACQEAFQFAFDFEILHGAHRLYEAGFYSCTIDRDNVTFTPTSLRLSSLRSTVDNVGSDRERPDWQVHATNIQSPRAAWEFRHSISQATARNLLDELDLYPDKIQMNGYTVGQFKAVWQTLLVDAMMWRSRAERNPLSTPQLVQFREAVKVSRISEFMLNLARSSRMSRTVVRAVVDDLLFRKDVDQSLDIWTKPLIQIGAEHIALAPRLFMRNRIGRNFPKIWLQSHRASYNAATGSRVFEAAYINKIGKLIAPVADPNLIVSNKQLLTVGEVDLAFVDVVHETLLIVEAKCVIAPDTLRAQRNAWDQTNKGVKQVLRLLEAVRADPASCLSALFGKIGVALQLKQISGLVVCNWSYGPEEPTPIPVVSHYAIAKSMQATVAPTTGLSLLESLESVKTIDLAIEELRCSEYEMAMGRFHIRTPVTHYMTVPAE
jgi:hypothetical protein